MHIHYMIKQRMLWAAIIMIFAKPCTIMQMSWLGSAKPVSVVHSSKPQTLSTFHFSALPHF